MAHGSGSPGPNFRVSKGAWVRIPLLSFFGCHDIAFMFTSQAMELPAFENVESTLYYVFARFYVGIFLNEVVAILLRYLNSKLDYLILSFLFVGLLPSH